MREPELLDEISEAQRRGDAARLDGLLQRLPRPIDSALVPALLHTLVDDEELEEVAFSVVHIAETVPLAEYVPQLLDALPGVENAAPGWAEVLLLRVLNSSDALRLLLAAIDGSTSVEARQAVVAASRRLAQRRPDRFGDAAEAIAGHAAPTPL